MADRSYKLTLSLSDGSTINAGTITAPQGPNGANGVTFTPSVSAAGVLSWTNDGGLTNPDPVNIKGDAAVITESDVAGWGFTKNIGTITEIKMNGSSKGTSGVVDLGTVLTAHQDISGKQDKITSSNKLAASLVSGLASVATSGSYNDLLNKPTIPTNYVTTDTDWQEITSKKKFLTDQLIISNEIDIGASAPAPEANQYRYIDFLDKNDKRIGIVGASIDTNKCYGAYLQAGNVTSMGVLSTPDGFGYSYGPIPPNKDNTNKLATTSWTGRRYKSIADFGFTSQTTVKAIVQKIIDNWYEYCTFACTNDNFNNFSDTPDGWGTLIIEVGSNALRPLISFTKQVGDSNSYKYWQANIVRGANNQVTEIQWYEIITTNNFSLSGTTLTITL